MQKLWQNTSIWDTYFKNKIDRSLNRRVWSSITVIFPSKPFILHHGLLKTQKNDKHLKPQWRLWWELLKATENCWKLRFRGYGERECTFLLTNYSILAIQICTQECPTFPQGPGMAPQNTVPAEEIQSMFWCINLLCEISHHTVPGFGQNLDISFETIFKTFCGKRISRFLSLSLKNAHPLFFRGPLSIFGENGSHNVTHQVMLVENGWHLSYVCIINSWIRP